MSKKGITQISNSISTGGGGVNFEHNIQAVFLLSLILDGFCPVMNEKTKRVCFQARHAGYAVDDMVVFTERKTGEGQLLCQMKHKITVSRKNTVFFEFMTAAWHDFCDDKFDKEKDKIALAVAEISVKSLHSLRFLNAQANGSLNENEFYYKVNLKKYSSADNKETLNTIIDCITDIKGATPSDYEIWCFCRAFIILLFDLDFKESVNRTLTISLIMHRSSLDPALVWAGLVDYASSCDQNASTIDLANIDDSVRELFFEDQRTLYSSKSYAEIINSDELNIDNEINKALEDNEELPVIALIGSWNEKNANDCNIVEEITGIKYPEYIKKVRNTLCKHPDIITLRNGLWKVEKTQEILERSVLLFFDDTIERAFSSAREIYLQKSNRINKKDFSIFNSDKEYENSKELRKSLLMNLCWLNARKDYLTHVSQAKLEQKVYELVDGLLNKLNWETFASLRDELQLLAELSPEVFLRDIESNIINNRDEIIRLFPKKNENRVFTPNFLPNLLLSIDVLSWDPQYLSRSVIVLGMLESLPHDMTNAYNTPINSIVSIFLPWLPQTMADFSKRKCALSCLQKDNPEVYWKVLTKLLPQQTRSTIEKTRPRFLPISIPNQIQITDSDLREQNIYFIKLAVEHAQNSIYRTIFLTDFIRYMTESTLETYIFGLENLISDATDDERYLIWNKLKINISKATINWKNCNENVCKRIQALLDKIEPHDILQMYKNLFTDECSPVLDLSEDELNKNRQEKEHALKEIYRKYGISELERFGKSVQDIWSVANVFGEFMSPEELNSLLRAYEKNETSKDFTLICIKSFINHPESLHVLETCLQNCSNEIRKDILIGIPYTPNLDQIIEKLLSNESIYWENAIIPRFFDENNIELFKIFISKLVQNHRLVAAVNVIGHSNFDKIFEVDFLVDLLKRTGAEESKGKDKLDEHSVQRIFKYLENNPDVSIYTISDLEMIYLPILSYGGKIPHSLSIRIGMDPVYFCEIIEAFFKRHHDSAHTKKDVSKPLLERLATIVVNFCVVPGVDSNGSFSSTDFENWIKYVNKWSKENDRYEVTMQTVGAGLSYSITDECEHPPKRIIEELNKAENNDLRIGFQIGTYNQRGAHIVDPEGKPELELSQKYEIRANQAEEMGYSRYAQMLMDISEQYKKEALKNIEEALLRK